MTATVTVDNTARNYYGSFRDSLVAGFSALGISGSNVVYNSGNFVIFKVSSGTGTYANAYLKFELNGITTYAHSLTVGTGHMASALSAALVQKMEPFIQITKITRIEQLRLMITALGLFK